MRRLTTCGSAALLTAAAAILCAGPGAAVESPAAALAALGAELLPGHESFEVGGSALGLLSGDGGFEEKAWVLVTASGGGHAVTIEVARALADLELGRDVVIALLPQGVDGAGDLPSEKLAAVFDLSAASAIVGNRLTVAAVGSSPAWPALLEQANVPVGIDLELSAAPDLSLAGSLRLFAQRVPGLQLVSPPAAEGGEVDSDRLARFAALVVSKASRLAEAPVFSDRETRAEESSQAVTRIFTGTIPDYAADVEGLRLSGVVPDGPAAAAGLAAGDVIVQIGERQIGDVYAYAEVLDELVADEPLSVVFVRDGERRETTMTPRARP